MSNKNFSNHYDSNYFAWQKSIGLFSGKACSFKFCSSVSSNDTVLDFGCGGGYLLKNLVCKKKIGIEPNHSAHEESKTNKIEIFDSPFEVLKAYGEESIDLIISNNALEHTLDPLNEIKNLFPLLKKGGKIHFVVPCDSYKFKWKENDINNHLYSWSPMNLGNLFTEAGYKVMKVQPYIHKWPPKYEMIQKVFGWNIFNIICRIYGRLDRSWFQVEIIASKQ